jgi:hypothetical protein
MYSASNLHQKNRETKKFVIMDRKEFIIMDRKEFIISDYDIPDKNLYKIMNTSNIIKGIQKPLHRLESIME